MKVVVDRIEGDASAKEGYEPVAVLVLYDDDSVKFDFPLKRLPEGVREGDHLQMAFTVDEKSRERLKDEVQNLLDELKEKNKD